MFYIVFFLMMEIPFLKIHKALFEFLVSFCPKRIETDFLKVCLLLKIIVHLKLLINLYT